MIEDIYHKIDPQQFGCLEGTSTRFQLIDMIDNWLKSIDSQSHYLRICLLDFIISFNRNILVLKLLPLGVRRSVIPWVCNFILYRKQSVRIDGYQSDFGFMNAEVP